MSYHNNQSNDTRVNNTSAQVAGVEQLTESPQSECYSNAPPTTTSLDTTVATITFNSNLEDIPFPIITTTNLVCTTKPDIFNKPQDFIADGGVVLQQSLLENFIGPNAATHNMRIYGDAGSRFIFFLKDITNNKNWDWYVHSSNSNFPNDAQWRVNTIDASHENPFAYPPAGAPGGPQNYIPVEFPAVSVNTTYHAYFTTDCSTCTYLDHLPTQVNPWVINQLADITLTAQFLNGENILFEGDAYVVDVAAIDVDTYVTAAGGIFPTPGNDGVWNVDISFSMDESREGKNIVWNQDRLGAGNGSGGANNDVVTIDNIQLPATGNLPEILSIDCKASIVASSTQNGEGRILGTITLGNVGLINQSLIFPASEFFAVG
tara:strand:+ start:5942 stop:7069 length:1128 start_codon:yes stop_codon:yes gene_type:complete